MMKSILFLTVVLLSGIVNGQRNFRKVTKGHFYWSSSVSYEYELLKKEKGFLKENQVKSREKTRYHNNNPSRETQTFNTEGDVVSVERKGKILNTSKNSLTMRITIL